MSGAAVTRGVGWPLKAVRQALREALCFTTAAAAGAINNGEFTRGRTSEAWGGVRAGKSLEHHKSQVSRAVCTL